MRLSIGFALIFAAIAFVQSKPLLIQVNGVQDFLGQYGNVLSQLQGVAGNVSPAQLQQFAQQAAQLAQSVVSGEVDVSTAVSQVVAFVQQLLNGNAGLTRPANTKTLPLGGLQNFLGQYGNVLSQLQGVAGNVSPAQLQQFAQQAAQLAQNVVSGQVDVSTAVSQVVAFVQQLLNGNAGLTRPANTKTLPLGGLQNFLGQYGNVLSQLQGVASNVLPAQLQTLAQQASQLAQSVVSGEVDVSTAVSQVVAFVQQLLNGNAGLTRPANTKTLPLGGLQNFLGQYGNVLSQLQGAASNVSPAQLQQFAQQAAQLAQSVVSGQVDVSTAVSQVVAFVQQLLNGNAGLTRPANTKTLPLGGLQNFLGQYGNVLSQLQGAASNVLPAQLQQFAQQAAQLAQSVVSGQVDVNTALSQVVAFVQQLLNGNAKALPFGNVQDLLNQYGNVLSQFQGLAQQVASALSQAELQTLGQQAAQLAQGVVSGQVSADAAAGQVLALAQQYLGSNPELYNAVANAVQQLLNLFQGN